MSEIGGIGKSVYSIPVSQVGDQPTTGEVKTREFAKQFFEKSTLTDRILEWGEFSSRFMNYFKYPIVGIIVAAAFPPLGAVLGGAALLSFAVGGAAGVAVPAAVSAVGSVVTDEAKGAAQDATPLKADSIFLEKRITQAEADIKAECGDKPPDTIDRSYMAAKVGSLASLKDSLAAVSGGVDINEKLPGSGKTRLHYAIESGRPSIVKYLLDHKADPSIQDSEDQTLFLLAVESRNVGVITAFLEHPNVTISAEELSEAKEILEQGNSSAGGFSALLSSIQQRIGRSPTLAVNKSIEETLKANLSEIVKFSPQIQYDYLGDVARSGKLELFQQVLGNLKEAGGFQGEVLASHKKVELAFEAVRSQNVELVGFILDGEVPTPNDRYDFGKPLTNASGKKEVTPENFRSHIVAFKEVVSSGDISKVGEFLDGYSKSEITGLIFAALGEATAHDVAFFNGFMEVMHKNQSVFTSEEKKEIAAKALPYAAEAVNAHVFNRIIELIGMPGIGKLTSEEKQGILRNSMKSGNTEVFLLALKYNFDTEFEIEGRFPILLHAMKLGLADKTQQLMGEFGLAKITEPQKKELILAAISSKNRDLIDADFVENLDFSLVNKDDIMITALQTLDVEFMSFIQKKFGGGNIQDKLQQALVIISGTIIEEGEEGPRKLELDDEKIVLEFNRQIDSLSPEARTAITEYALVWLAQTDKAKSERLKGMF